MNPALKNLFRGLLPRTLALHRIRSGQLRGAWITTSWHDYPAAIMGYAEKALTAWLLENVRAGETWLDVGAHYGYTSLAMSRQTGAVGRVFAFEPSLSSAGCIARTRLANRHWGLTVCPFALDDSPQLTVRELPWTRGMIDSQLAAGDSSGTERFMGVALDVVWPQLAAGDGRIHGIKIDVQGMEISVLEGMRRTLAQWRPKLVLEIHPGVDRERVLRLLEAAGYGRAGRAIEPGPTDFHDPQSNYSFLFEPARAAGPEVR